MSAEAIRAELDRLRLLAADASVERLRDGSWLTPLLRETVDDYVLAVDRGQLQAAHPGLDDDALADARIADAQWRAALAAGTSAGAYASVVMASLATGVFVGAALPAAVTAFAVDLYYQARLQLCLAWDLALIYRHDLDPRDDDDLWTLVRVAFGTDEEAPAHDLARPTVPLASRFGTRALTTAARLATGVQAVGRTLALRSLARFAIPAVGVPLCAGVSHVTVGAVGRAARRIFRDRAAGRSLAAELKRAEELVLAAVVLILHADQRLARAEVATLAGLAADVDGDPVDPTLLALGEDALLDRIRAAPGDLRAATWHAALAAAEVDGHVAPEEQRLLGRLQEVCRA